MVVEIVYTLGLGTLAGKSVDYFYYHVPSPPTTAGPSTPAYMGDQMEAEPIKAKEFTPIKEVEGRAV